MAHILVIDGNRDEAHESLCVPLRQRGFDVLSVTAIETALSAFECDTPQLLISELHLPDGTGLELLHRLRLKGSSIPLVILTRSPSIKTAVRAIQLGAQDYLEKPLLPSVAVQLAEGLIGPPDRGYPTWRS